jgi:signal peptidase I
LPTTARIASILAFLLAGLIVISAAIGQIIVLPTALIPLMAGIGIMRRRVWSAYGFALYFLAQLLFLPLVFWRPGGAPSGVPSIAGIGAFAGALAILYFFVGRSLASAAGSERGWAWPWIALASLATIPFIFVQAFVIPTGAMEDTLLIGDRILARRIPKPRVEEGDIVVHIYPIDRRQTFVKRVIGVPGDRIRISNKVVYRNGAALQEPYAQHKTEYQDTYRDDFPSEPNVHLAEPAMEMLSKNVVKGEVVVPEGKYFVLGDNRDSSLDSRYWGFLDSGDVIAKPLLIYYSADQPGEGLMKGTNSRPRHIRWSRFFRTI